MKIEKHISELLFRYDRIIVPGLGMFTCSHESASVHPITHRFQPPNKRVAFDANVKEDPDNMLALYVAKVERMAAEDVDKGISDYVATVISGIASASGVEISKVGTLKNDDQGNIILKPDSETNVFAPAFGMGEFRSPAIERSKKPSRKKEEAVVAAVVIAEEKEKSRKGFWIAAIIILLLLIGSLGYWKRQEINNFYVSITNSNDTEKLANTDDQGSENADAENSGNEGENDLASAEPYAPRTSENGQELQGAEKLEAELSGKELLPNAYKEEPAKKVRRKPVRKYTAADIVVEYPDYYKEQTEYFLIAGCFVYIKNAREYREKLLRQGYESEVVGAGSDGCYRVSYGKYYLEEEALGRLNYIRSTINDGAWLLKR